jgi:hypothetical protein
MEATGQYWKPVWDVLAERGFELMLVNARHVKILSFAVCPVLLVLCERYLWRDRRVAVIRR